MKPFMICNTITTKLLNQALDHQPIKKSNIAVSMISSKRGPESYGGVLMTLVLQ